MANKTKTSYRVAKRTPSERKEPGRNYIPPMNKPKPRSKLLEFVESNRHEDRPEAETQALIRLFQEHECNHPSWKELAKSGTIKIVSCAECHMVKTGKP